MRRRKIYTLAMICFLHTIDVSAVMDSGPEIVCDSMEGGRLSMYLRTQSDQARGGLSITTRGRKEDFRLSDDIMVSGKALANEECQIRFQEIASVPDEVRVTLTIDTSKIIRRGIYSGQIELDINESAVDMIGDYKLNPKDLNLTCRLDLIYLASMKVAKCKPSDAMTWVN